MATTTTATSVTIKNMFATWPNARSKRCGSTPPS